MPPPLVVDHLSISAGGLRLLTGVTFSVDAGERVALVGASGSGKSLTAAAVLGTLSAGLSGQGAVSVEGRTVSPHGPAGRDGSVAGIAQDSSAALNPVVRVGVQLALPYRRRHGGDKSSAAAAALDLLASVGIEDPARVAQAYPAELSGGQRQRVCIAMALVGAARVLVADEPTTALDVVNQAQVLRALRDYADRTGAGVLFITHDLAVAATLCDSVVVLSSGEVVESGPVDSVLRRPQHPYTQALVRAARSTHLPAAAEVTA